MLRLVYHMRHWYIIVIIVENCLFTLRFSSPVLFCVQLRCGEKILKQPLFYIISGAAVWGVALYFFFERLTSWQVWLIIRHVQKKNHSILSVTLTNLDV